MVIRKYIIRIVVIIFLTYIPALAILGTFFEESIGWIAGSLGSIGNFLWLSLSTRKVLDFIKEETRLRAYKGFYLRYAALALYSVVVILALSPDIITFGAGLVSVQMAIYLNQLVELIKKD